MTVTHFTIEEVRCFAGRQRFDLRPLTFLVGENSTGKTTTLACFQTLANLLRSEGVDFNIDPYSMGVFGDIVRRSRRKEKSFSLGFSFEDNDDSLDCTVDFVQKAEGIEPAVKAVTMCFDGGEIVFEGEDTGDEMVRRLYYDEQHKQIRLVLSTEILNYSNVGFAFLFGIMAGIRMDDEVFKDEVFRNHFDDLQDRIREFHERGHWTCIQCLAHRRYAPGQNGHMIQLGNSKIQKVVMCRCALCD
ncbi:MAG: hypothetical protein OXJ55_00955 [Caldilineaceae bacterium]|nr:hypothetical protein [Caldilineaceae bacterium]MDE0461512.1 hypothetical protein [Caldilineaceae bacterium]